MAKSIKIESEFQVGIFKGLNSLTGCWYSAMAFLANQTFIHNKYSAISLLILFHKNISSNLCTHWCPLGAPNSKYYEPPLRSAFLRFFFILWSARSLSWFTLGSSIREGYKVNTRSWTFAFQCDTNWLCKSSSSLKKFSWVITTVFIVCYAFLFRASTTILPVLGWQWICHNWCFM